MSSDNNLHSIAVNLQLAADAFHYTYHHEWLGVPIIRLPDDILLQHEIVFHLRPSVIIETGVARGGSLILSASCMALSGIEPHVLGLDLLIMPHARDAIAESRFSNSITLWEGDSASSAAQDMAKSFLNEHVGNGPVLLVLDSNHSEEHVLSELNNFSDLLSVGSVVMIADTIIEELPQGYFVDRPWDVGNNPMTAVVKFLESNGSFEHVDRWRRRSLLSEFRDGIIEKRF